MGLPLHSTASVKCPNVKMKLILFAAAFLFVQTWANPIEFDTPRDELMTIDFDDEDDCGAVFSQEECASIEDYQLTYGPIEDLTDAALEKLIEEKLKIFKWLIGHIPMPQIRDHITNFVDQNRDAIKAALKQGGMALVGLIRNFVI